MASSTKKTELIRQRHHRKAGKDNRRKNRKGSTPAFPIHQETAEQATESQS